MIVKILPTDTTTTGKLADAELHFGVDQFGQLDGEPLEGLKLIGFSVWERVGSGGRGARNVTFPARSYSINGERRSFALLRPVGDGAAGNKIRDLILSAYAEFEKATV
jgi:hypothetical protein